MLDFSTDGDSLDLRQLLESTKKFALRSLDPAAGANCSFDRKHFREMAELALTGISVREVQGGLELSYLHAAAAIFEIARAQLGPAIYLSVHLMVSRLIDRFGANDQLRHIARRLAAGEALGAFCLTESQAGSDAGALALSAKLVNDGFELSGEKIYITSAGEADEYLVFARTAESAEHRISAFVVEKSARGLSFGKPEHKMGCAGSPIATVHFDRVLVPASRQLGVDGQGFRIALAGLAGGRVNIAAAACGIASRSIAIAAEHLKQRKQFGKPLAHFQGLQFMLADLVQALRASIALTREAAAALDRGERGESEASIAKCFATDAAMRITTDAVQLLGGAGYIEEYHVERMMRDAKMLQIVEGTNQIQRHLIARALLGPEFVN